MTTQDTRVSACNDFADILSGTNRDADMTIISLPSNDSCSFYDSESARRYLIKQAGGMRAEADRICGAGLERRIDAGKLRTEFSDIVKNANAGEAARRIGNRMALFAPDIDLRRCIETAGIRDEPAVMTQPFNQIVPSCELMLGLPAQSPEQRWRIPSVDEPIANGIGAASNSADNAASDAPSEDESNEL
ncbi:hypothetical protein [Sphingomonas sp.]|jgi:hypothetical protein|uniref:hypothetical protein n=1 Tax=Sphingomonas sp. TaxID=28214 RepID=UPI002E345B33|nr:hypothetical protein [Sphingomonas sp.]HEX4694093.1 hypothetical protein [Sphingomonas sp.]